MRLIVLLLCGILIQPVFTQEAADSQPLSQRTANYDISGEYFPDAQQFRGTAVLSWTNVASIPARELRFHMYMNAFANPQTTFLRDYGEVPATLDDNWGFVRIEQLQLDNSPDIHNQLQFIQPEDDNPNDSTVARIMLSQPVPPGEAVEIKYTFTTKLPALVERAGYLGNFIMAAQWYPKIGVFSAAGWQCHQYHGNSEFFADFGTYRVRLTVPENWVVGASGTLQETIEQENQRKTLHYYAEDVHDFAWGANPDYIVRETTSGNMKIRLLLLPGHEGELAERILHSVKSSHVYFETNYGRYPYPQLTILDTPVFSTVMEYPTLFLTGNFDGYSNPPAPKEPQPENNRFPERLTIHEFAHQWFYGMSANNEFAAAWMDEGITEYITAKAFEAAYGPIMQPDLQGNPLPVRDFRKNLYLANPGNLPILLSANRYPTFREYYVGSYVKPKLFFYTIDNVLGEAVMAEVIRRFFQTWQFRHPRPANFFSTFGAVTGGEYQTLAERFFSGSDSLDYSITENDNGQVLLVRNGNYHFPVDVALTNFNGEVRMMRWDGLQAAYPIDVNIQAPINKIVIDPQVKLEFETNRKNNIWIRR